MLTEEQEKELQGCHTLEELFSTNTFNVISSYRDIVNNFFLQDNLQEELIVALINNGNEEVIVQNIDVLSPYANWKIAEKNSEFKKVFLENLPKALENKSSFGIDNNMLRAINKENETLIVENWEAITKNTNNDYFARKELISILNSSEDGKEIIDSQLSKLFYGKFNYAPYIKNLLNEDILSQEQISGLILESPSRMLEESMDYRSSHRDIIDLINVTNDILEATPELDFSKVQNTRTAIEDVMVQKFDKLLSKLLVPEYDKNYKKVGEEYSVEALQVIKSFFNDKEKINKKLIENGDIISNNIKSEDTMDLIHLYSDTDSEIKNIDVKTIMSKTFSNIKDSNLQWAISGIANELLQSQNLKPDDMQIYGSGKYSKTIKAGEYVFKVGEPRSTSIIKNDERIIQPLFRREIKNEDGENIFIEVQDLVEKDWYKGLTEEQINDELYKVYSEMRDRGIRWTDARRENVGRLLKPNTGEYDVNGRTMKGMNAAKGFIEDENREEVKALGAGELVVIDTDYIFDAQEQEYSVSIYSMHKEFEKRYQKEKAENMKNSENNKSPLLTSTVKLSKEHVSSNDMITVSNMLTKDINKGLNKEGQKDTMENIEK